MTVSRAPGPPRTGDRSCGAGAQAFTQRGHLLGHRDVDLLDLQPSPGALGSSILGLTVARHFLKLEALAEISDEQIATVIRPWLTAAVDGPPEARSDLA